MDDRITYRDAGVNIDAGNEAVERIREILSGSNRRVSGCEEVGGIGGFSGAIRPFLQGYTDPLLIGSTDGVGTKLLLALEYGRLDDVGQDLVAMCVNDLVVCGARPLFFLDYIATAKLDPDEIEVIVTSVQAACEESDCLLIGGETAEMPGMYAPGHTDLAGFAVGIVDRKKIIDGHRVKPGDVVLGIASSGIHSNGFSLVRKVIERAGWLPNEVLEGCESPLIDIVLKPTKLYVRPLLKLFEELGTSVKACAHITGGGLTENIPRVIPDTCSVILHRKSWPEPPIFGKIIGMANLPDDEADRTFNRGIGCAVVVDSKKAGKAVKVLESSGETVWKIGEIIERKKNKPPITIK
ncbi:MAG: phosphoribosylformylglycinamidine cyclo-ligase [bacterium]